MEHLITIGKIGAAAPTGMYGLKDVDEDLIRIERG